MDQRRLINQQYTEKQMEKQAMMLANRVKKTFQHLSKKFRKQELDCFRIYHWDIPEIRAVIDWYDGHIVMAEYVRTQTSGTPWLEIMGKAVAAALNVPEEKLFLKSRRTRPQQGERYQRLAQKEKRLIVRERTLRFHVNLSDYIDTGLFSDHRNTRLRILSEVTGKRFLNLFAYTGSFTCYAAAGGAISTTSVDLSSKYLNWAEENLSLNNLADPMKHRMVRSDSMTFLEKARQNREYWDIIIIDPPSLSERNDQVIFDVQRDHLQLLNAAWEVLSPGGIMYFSTNFQAFEPKFEALKISRPIEITSELMPEDFIRRPSFRCFLLTKN